MTLRTHKRMWAYLALVLLAMMMAMTGCPVVPPTNDQILYDRGWNDGFLQDDWYWQGYSDSYDTVNAGPMYYQASTIPYYDTPPYDAGYWDGVWYAYNDGYFTDYRYAFILGFSEGYDNAYWPDYLAFLASDAHVEYLDGGWSDGYNDGFSEGRVFGANDYEQGLTFDWVGALKDYEDGVDLYFQEVNVGTGIYGPVVLYEYGTDPTTAKQGVMKRALRKGGVPSIRTMESGKLVNTDNRELFRPLDAQAQQELSKVPANSLRAPRDLRLKTTWLSRVTTYISSAKSDTAKVNRARAVEVSIP